MSLTSHIKQAGSPVRAFFESRLGDTAPAVRAAADHLRGGQAVAPLAASPGVDPGRAGTAVDYLLRFAVAADPCPRYASVDAGAGMLDDFGPSALQAVREGLELVSTVAAHTCTPTDDEWSDLTEISLIFATFEAVYRSQGILPACLNELPTPPVGWRAWAQAICTEIEVEDLAVLGWAAASDHADLRDGEVMCNPTFEQSAELGGADADLITGEGCLIDMKSTSTTAVCSRADLWQICGYALADTNDELGITHVGISALRWRSRVSWALTDLLTQLAGERVELASLRGSFAELLASGPPSRVTPVRLRRRV